MPCWYCNHIVVLCVLQTLDLSTLRQVLEMYSDLSLCVPSTSHLQTLFTAMASRLDLIVSVNPLNVVVVLICSSSLEFREIGTVRVKGYLTLKIEFENEKKMH